MTYVSHDMKQFVTTWCKVNGISEAAMLRHAIAKFIDYTLVGADLLETEPIQRYDSPAAHAEAVAAAQRATQAELRQALNEARARVGLT